ncbi:hypothetical protein PV08_03747 [Exophiala spinifera]|uniref:Uncharacterized protein n=1 Tax=Exophiala spinifera TaxID=91928 RepID=A0A0D2BZ38_9EURO|nr:uncharacterized protein PV08_03747 [Exophiala spinifera]KIW16559.1 hypothetical protein PV08_03747 [Exophiala spinifera]
MATASVTTLPPKFRRVYGGQDNRLAGTMPLWGFSANGSQVVMDVGDVISVAIKPFLAVVNV